MSDESEVPIETLQEKIADIHQELAGLEQKGKEAALRARDASWITYLAVTTALMAVLAAISSLLSGQAADDALLRANDAVYYETIAVNSWAEFQADSIKAVQETTIAAVLTQLHAPASAVDTANAEAARRKANQATDQAAATKAERQREEARSESNAQSRRRERFAFAVTLFQVGIGLSAVAALVRLRALWYLSLVGAAAGIILLASGFLPVAVQAAP